MKVLFWGTPDFAVKCLKALLKSHHQVVGVITQPDRPKGRGQKVQPTPVKEEAAKHNIPIFQPEKIKNNQNLIQEIRKLNPDISVVVAYGKILPEEIINIPKYKTINVHASLLPEYRGAAPIQRALMEGKEKTGVCIMEIVKELDAGDVYACKEVPILEDDDIVSLHDKLAEEGSKLLIEVLDKIEKGDITKKPQDHERSTYAKPIEKSEGKIVWHRSAREIFNQIRSLKVWPKAYTKFRGEEVKILDAKVVECDSNGIPGEIIKADDKEGIVVKTGNGCILLKVIQFPNSKPITTNDAIRGHKIKVGEKFEEC